MNKIYIIALMFLATITAKAQNDITVHDDQTGKDEEIGIPEAMTLDIDTLLRQWNASQYLEADTNCNMQDVNPVFSDSIYVDRLSRIPTIMEMPYNNIVRKFIDQYTGRLRHSVSYMLGATNFYIPIFEEALALYNLPLELKYLPVIESALDPTAVSRKGATGLWQFMLSTAKRYDLKINSLVDERRDPIKASFAAAQYLNDLYKVYGDWNLVIAAYNCGPTSLNKAIHRAGGSKDYWTIYPYLPKETRGYVPAFIAANYVMNYYCEHNICPMRARLIDGNDTVVVNKDLHLEQVASVCGVEMEKIKAFNPQYKTSLVPGNSYDCILRLPSEAALKFIDLGDSVYSYRSSELLTKRKTVEIDEAELEKQQNSARRSYSSSRRRSSRSSRRSKSVTIKNGQTLSEIAEKYGTSVSKLRRLNGIKGSNIRAGKKIRVK
ncbi:MAG: transglycosylase SLT domain-containing protein [Prevotellaceae bacterium]|nr:transglycosylase SLT domain-containing protein [Bacteroidaceae bacterium]MCI6519649.1 transglycosylase SLT domain-containing protein [Prevotellaceae bacterium]MDD7377066.1 transglycosylase SLT domain-containing protein [Prevotellaceae bacterium]